jgi:UDP-N-acetylmuramate dehydrogenase
VLVNRGGATGDEVMELAHRIVEDIHAKFGIRMVPEVNYIY